MSRLLKKVENEATVLRKDLNTLKSARMMDDPDFQLMYTAALEHHRHLKLSHLSGKSDDIIQKLVTDTYLYVVLMKMLMEVEARSGANDKEVAFDQVKKWYKANSHKLTSRPKFSAKRELPTPHLINISVPSPRRPNTTPTNTNKIIFPSQKSAQLSRNSSTRDSLVTKQMENDENKVPETVRPSSPNKSSDVMGTDDNDVQRAGESDKENGEKEAIEQEPSKEINEADINVENALSEETLTSKVTFEDSTLNVMPKPAPPNTPANDAPEGDKKRSQTANPSSDGKGKSVYPISSYVTPFQSSDYPSKNPLLKADGSQARHSARFLNAPSLQTVHLVLQQHSHGAQYQLWREEDEITLRERRIQGEIVSPNQCDWQDQLKKKDEEMDGLGCDKMRVHKLEPAFADYDTEEFLRHTEGYYPLHIEKSSRLTSAQSTNRQEELFIKQAIQALSDVSTDMMSNQRKEMQNVRWDERIEPLRLISHLACPPSRESQYYGPESTNLLLLDENLEPEANRGYLLENAADWRGKITPSPTSGYRPKSPFSRHTFVKRLLQQRNRQQVQRVRPLSAPAPPPNTSPVQCAPSVPDTGRCTPPSLKPSGVKEAVKVQHLGGQGEDPWEAWMRRMRMRRHPIRKGRPQTEPPTSTEYLSIITPATALGVFGVAENVSNEEVNQADDSGERIGYLDSQSNLIVPDTTPNVLSYADMEQLIRTHSAPPKNTTPNKKSPMPSARLLSNMQRTAPSIPSGRDHHTSITDLNPNASSESFPDTKFRLPRYTSVHPSVTRTTSRPNSAKREVKGTLSVVGMTVNAKSDPFTSSMQRAREEGILLSRSMSPGMGREYSRPNTPSAAHSRETESLKSESNDSRRFESSQNGETISCNTRSPTPSKLQRTTSKPTMQSSRPIPHYYEVNDPDYEARRSSLMKEAASSVDITKIFHANVPKNYLLRLSKEQRERLEDERKAAIVIQRCYRRHLNRCKTINTKSRDGDMKKWLKKYRRVQEDDEMTRKQRIEENQRQVAAIGRLDAQKLSMIGAHVDIYEYFHPPRDGPTKRQKHIAAVIIQKWVRGWLTRVFTDRLKRKALYHADSFKTFVGDYFALMKRIQRRNGIRNPTVRFNLREMEHYMDTKRKYELAFDSKAFRGQLLEKDVMKFFDECDLSPAKYEIREALDVLHKNNSNYLAKGLSKSDALELVFQIYKPKGTDLHNSRKSTWMHPLLNGIDAIRLVDQDELEPTPLSVCLKLVLESRQEQLSWEQKQRMKAEIKSLEETELRASSEKVLREKIKHELDKRKSHQATAIPWIND